LLGGNPPPRWGAPGDDPARSSQSGQARALTISAGPDPPGAHRDRYLRTSSSAS